MKAYQVKVTLKDVKPLVWRRLMLPAEMNLSLLHTTLNLAMGWRDCHLHKFCVPSLQRTVVPELEEWEDTGYFTNDKYENEEEMLLSDIAEESGRFYYIYDLGDNWEHVIDVEKCEDEYPYAFPRVIKASGNCPPEDCGGSGGYKRFLQIIQDPRHPEYEEMKAWGETQNYSAYDMGQVNLLLEDKVKVETQEDEEKSLSEIAAIAGELLEAMLQKDEKLLTGEERKFLAFMQKDFTLKEELSQYTVEQLKAIAKLLKLTGVNKFRKEDLVDWLAESMVREDVMKQYFAFAYDDELEFFERLCISPAECNDWEEGQGEYFFKAGYAGINPRFQMQTFPAIAETYACLKNGGLNEEREHVWEIINYCYAAAHLYGIFELAKFIEIYNSHHSRRINIAELDGVIEAMESDGWPLVRKGNYLMLEWLNEGGEYRELLMAQNGKPYYLPNREIFVQYSDPLFFETSKAFDSMKRFLANDLKCLPAAFTICNEIRILFWGGGDTEDAFDYLEDAGIELKAGREAEKLTIRLTAMYNDTRCIYSRGYTPYELKPGAAQMPSVVKMRPPIRPVFQQTEAGKTSNVIPFPKKKQFE